MYLVRSLFSAHFRLVSRNILLVSEPIDTGLVKTKKEEIIPMLVKKTNRKRSDLPDTIKSRKLIFVVLRYLVKISYGIFI